MYKFECFRCKYNTKYKNNFKKHLQRKNICEPIYGDISIKYICQSYNIIL